MDKKVIEWLKKNHACNEAVEWAQAQKTPQEAWRICERGDWMLWMLGKLSGEPESAKRKKLVLACCECARLSLKYVQKDEKQPLIAIQTVEKWAKGKATIEDVRAAASSAHAHAAASSASDAAASSAYAAAHAGAYDAHAYADAAAAAAAAYAYAAANAAYAASDAAAYAANAAAAAAYDAAAYDAHAHAAAHAYAAAARKKTLSKCADIVRKYYPKRPIL